MSILARFAPPSMTAEKYNELVALLYAKGIIRLTVLSWRFAMALVTK
tara:strand:+ start:71 stop:211 length:141 start_codon:yes stop_codon:yes gene_type:complete